MGEMTFWEACRLWEADKARFVKPTSMAAYSLTIRNHLEPRFKDLRDITEDAVQALVDMELSMGNNITTVKGIVLVLKMVVRYCERQGWTGRLECSPRFPARLSKPEPKILSAKEFRMMVDYLASHPTPMNTGLLICVCSGLRIGEVCALKWKDVDFFNKVIQVRRTVYRIYNSGGATHRTELMMSSPKTMGSCRDVPITDKLINILSKQYVDQGKEAFLLSGTPVPMDPQNFRNNLRRVELALGLPHRKVHSLRHTFATRCVDSGCDVKTLSTILGHSNISTTMNLYVHPDLEQKRRCVEKMMESISD